jgi:hypothetical protein
MTPPDVHHLRFVVEAGGVKVYISGDLLHRAADNDASTRLGDGDKNWSGRTSPRRTQHLSEKGEERLALLDTGGPHAYYTRKAAGERPYRDL